MQSGNVINEGYKLNNPIFVRKLEKQTGILPDKFSFAECSDKNIVIETIKMAEDKSGYIVRMYESFDKRGKCLINFGIKPSRVYKCNLLEEIEKELKISVSTVELDYKNFEILTLKVTFQ